MGTNGWQDVDLADVSTAIELLPEGTYTFQVLAGTKYSDFRPGQLDIPVAVVGGEYSGRRAFMQLPNPAEPKFKWALTAGKRLVEAIGSDINKGEEPTVYFNRVAGLRFEMPVAHTQAADSDTKYLKFQFFKVRPSQN